MSRQLLGLLLAGVVGVACTPVGGPGADPEPAEDPDADPEAVEAELPALEEGDPDPEGVEAAASLLEEARSALADGDPGEARRLARSVMEDHPRAGGSAEALWVLAQGALEEGDYGEADEAVSDFLDFLSSGDHGRVAQARLLQGRARFGENRFADGIASLVAVPPEAPDDVMAETVERARAPAQGLDDGELEAALADAPGPVGDVLRVERAVRYHLDGDDESARGLMDETLAGSPRDEERRAAEAIMDGRFEDVVGAVAGLGALLPVDGPPSLLRSAEEISYGLEVAVRDLEGTSRRGMELLLGEDLDEADNSNRVRELENAGALAFIGPLDEAELREAAEARETDIPVVSPTAGRVPEELRGQGVYSLRSVDPGEPRMLAEHARGEGHSSAVILRPNQERAEEKARLFAEAFEEAGGSIRSEVEYPAGQADLADEMGELRGLDPSLIFLPVPADDAENVATQMAFHEVTDADPTLLGTEGWASEDALRSVSPQHTDGMQVAVPVPAGEDPPAHQGFVDAYEGHFQRTFRSPDAALGWDAVKLVARVLNTGARTGEDVRRQLERTEGFEGATGTLSVRNDLIVRERELARIEDGEVRPFE